MTHDEARDALSAGQPTPGITEHLGACADCTRYGATLERIRSAAPKMFSESPSDLAETVLTAVRASAAAGAAPSIASVTPIGWRRHFGARTAVAASVAAVIAAVAVLVPHDPSDPVLVGVAKKTAGAGTAVVDLSADFSFVLNHPIVPPLPNLGRIRDSFANAVRGPLADNFRRSLRSIRIPRIAPISKVTSTARAHGEVVFPDRLHLSGTETTTRPGMPTGAQPFESIVTEDGSWVRTNVLGARKWVALPSLPLEVSIDFNPAHLLARMRTAGARGRLVGTETLGGERVRHYRFEESQTFGSFIGTRSAVIDAWIGDADGSLRRMHQHFASDTGVGKAEASIDVRFSELGSHQVVIAPPASEIVTLDEAVAGAIGLAFGVGAASFMFAFNLSVSVPDIRFRIHLPALPRFPIVIPTPPKFPNFPRFPSFTPRADPRGYSAYQYSPAPTP